MKRYTDILFITLITLVSLLFFYPILLGKHPVPTDDLVGLYHPWRDHFVSKYPSGVPFKNFLITDPVRQQIPWRKISIDQWKDGKIPVWNPTNFLGSTLIGNIQAGVLYLFNIFFWVLDFSDAWTVIIVLEPILAAVFMYLFLRRVKLGPLPAILGAFSWGYSGFQIAWLTWGTIGHVSLWIPFMLYCINKIFSEYYFAQKNSIWYAFLILAIVNAFFAGHSQIFLYTTMVTLLYAFWKTKNTNQGKSRILWIVFCYTVAFLILSFQLLPLIHQFQSSARSLELLNDAAEGWLLPWYHLVQFIVPDFFGNPSTLNYWGVWNYGEMIGYIGIVPLLFAFYSLFFVRNSEVLFFKIILFGSLVFLIKSPFTELMYRLHIPVMSSLQPTRLLVLVDLSLAILAAFGLQNWLNKKNPKLNLLTTLMIFFLGGLLVIQTLVISKNSDSAIVGKILVSRNNTLLPLLLSVSGLMAYKLSEYTGVLKLIGPYLLVLITVFDLFRFGWKFTPFSLNEYFYPETKIITFLKNAPKPFRVMSIDDRIIPPNTLAYYGIESVGGYDPLYGKKYEEFIAASEQGKPDVHRPFGFNRIISPKNIDSPLLRYMNVKYVLSLDEITNPFLKKITEDGLTKVYEYEKNLGWGYFVCKVVPLRSDVEILDALFQIDQNQSLQAYTELKYFGEEKRFDCDNSKLTVNQYNHANLRLTAKTISESFLVLSTIYAPETKVFIDSKEATVIPTNYLFIGVLVPYGLHELNLKFGI